MNLYKGLLFLHGHVADTDLACRLTDDVPAKITPVAAAPAARRAPARPGRVWRALLRNLWMLGGRPMTAGHNDDLEEPFERVPCAQRIACRALAAGGFR
jgi:hypothetical protein